MSDSSGVTHRKVDDIFILELPARLDAAAAAEATRWAEWGLADSPGAVIVAVAAEALTDTLAVSGFPASAPPQA